MAKTDKKVTGLDEDTLDEVRGGATAQYNPETLSRTVEPDGTSAEEQTYLSVKLTNARITSY